MSVIEPCTEFHRTFTREITSRLTGALGRAYETVLEFRAPKDRGYTEQMFGFNLAGYCAHELTVEIEVGGSPFRALLSGSMFRFIVNDFEIGCYRAGRNERENIWESFPDNDTGIQSLANDENLWLPNMAPKPLPKLVLAHFGNSTDGICAVYLCAPKRFENGRIVEWAFAHEIWKRDSDQPTFQSFAASEAPAPIERVEKPLIRRKPAKAPEKDNG